MSTCYYVLLPLGGWLSAALSRVGAIVGALALLCSGEAEIIVATHLAFCFSCFVIHTLSSVIKSVVMAPFLAQSNCQQINFH